MSKNRLLLTLVLLGLMTIAFAEVKDEGLITPIQYVPDKPQTVDTMKIMTQYTATYNTGTLRDIAVGVGLKGALDDTVRFFIANSASPRRQLLYTDTSTAGPIFRTAWRAEMIESSAVGFHAAAIGDANNDGIPEIIFGRSSTPYRLKRAQWDGSNWQVDTIAQVASYIYDIAIGDPDNDGLNEIYFTNGTALMKCFWNTGTSTWDTVRIWTSSAGTIYGVAIGNADPNKTGNELYVCTYGQTVKQWHSVGGAALNYAPIDSFYADVDFYDIAVGDYDPLNPGDEIAINNGYAYATYGNIFLLRNDGTTWWRTRFILYSAWGTLGEVNIGGPVFDFFNGNVMIFTPGSVSGMPIALWKDGESYYYWPLPSMGGPIYSGIGIGNINKWRTTANGSQEVVMAGGATGSQFPFLYQQSLQNNNDVAVIGVGFANAPVVAGDSAIVQVTIENTGYTTQTSIDVYYRTPAGLVGPETWTGTLPYNTTTTFNFATKLYMPDTTTIAVMCSTALSGGDDYPADDFMTANLKAYNTLSGTKTVGTSDADYTTITEALAAWNSSIITGNVTFVLVDATYPSETYPLTIYAPPAYSGGNWTLTIKPQTGVSPVIEGSNATAIFDLNGVQGVTFDGDNGADGKDMTISNTNTSGATIRFINGASYNTVKNCVVKGVVTTTTSGIILFSTSSGATGNNYNTIYNCDITSGTTFAANAVTGYGSANPKWNMYNTIQNCNIYDFSTNGVYAYANEMFLNVLNNNITTVTTQTSTSIRGVTIYGSNTTCGNIIGNKIYEFKSSGSYPYFYGVYLYYGSTTYVTTVANNMILFDATTTHPSAYIYGIYEGSGTNYLFDIYYNSIYFGGTDVTGGSSYGIYRGYQSIMNVKNNIVFNNRMNGTNTSNHYCFYASNTGAGLVSNYNDLYAGDATYGYVGYWTSARKTLLDWQGASGQDLNSISANPDFVSATDLHIQSSSMTVNRKGTPIATITTDFDGNTRNGLFPDIGADEYNPDMPGAPVLTYPASNAINVPLFGNLQWTASTMAQYYDVYLDVNNPPVNKVGSLVSGTSYPYSGLPVGTKHYWQVVAINDTTGVGDGQFTPSAVDSFTTATPPNAPSNLAITITGTTSLEMDWTDNSTDEDSFFVYQSTNGTDFTKIASLDANSTTYGVSGLSANTHYWYRVTAYNNMTGESNFTADDDWTWANTPGAPTFSDVGPYSMKVYIDLNGNPTTTEFNIRVNYGTDVTKYVDPTTGTLVDAVVWGDYAAFGGASGIVVSGLTTNTQYTFDVQARNGAMISTAYGPSAMQTTLPYRDVGVSAITVPPTGTIGGAQITPQVTVINNGQISEDITVTAEIAPPSNTVIIGTGTSTQRYPFGMYWGYERTATIYLASEIGFTGTINYLDWYIASLASHADGPVRIYLKTTTDATFAAATTWAAETAGATLVFDGNLTFTGGDWYRVTITPFNYTGGNLKVLVETNYGGTGGEGSTAKAIRYTSTSPDYRQQYWYADNNPPTGTGTRTYNRSNIRIVCLPPPIYTSTVVVPNVAGGSDATAEAYFTSWTPPATGDYVFKAYTTLAEDLNPANDEMTRPFSVDMTPPAVPALISPEDGATTNAYPTFEWSSVADAVEYNLVVDDGVAETDLDIYQTGTSYTHPTALTGGTGYTWKVRAKDAYENWSDFSAIRSLIVDDVPPAVPTPIAPAESALVTAETQEFVWNLVADAVEYELVVEPYVAPTPPEYTFTTSDTTYQTNLPSGVYTWKVRAKDAVGNWSDYSTPVYFTLQLPAWVKLADEVPQAYDVKAGKFVKDGGSMVAVGNSFYLFPGNKSWYFYKYTPGGEPAFETLESIPYGFKYDPKTTTYDPTKINKKKVGKGAALCYDGDSIIYAVKGNGTFEFWAYDMRTTVETIPHPDPESVQIIVTGPHWVSKAFIPATKGLKAGSSITWYNGKVYLLIGGAKAEHKYFWVYDPTADT
ncbi:MAG: fibronectin type III domain-containing protein, partial [candidate division WOR-3 bacterium]